MLCFAWLDPSATEINGGPAAQGFYPIATPGYLAGYRVNQCGDMGRPAPRNIRSSQLTHKRSMPGHRWGEVCFPPLISAGCTDLQRPAGARCQYTDQWEAR